MFLPFCHVSVQLVMFDRQLTIHGLFAGPFCPYFLKLLRDTAKYEDELVGAKGINVGARRSTRNRRQSSLDPLARASP